MRRIPNIRATSRVRRSGNRHVCGPASPCQHQRAPQAFVPRVIRIDLCRWAAGRYVAYDTFPSTHPTPYMRSAFRARRVVLIAVLFLMSAPTIPAQARSANVTERTFEVNSAGSDYPFVVSLRGVYRIFRDSVVVEIARGVIASQVPAQLGAKGRATDVTLAVGLGSGTPDSWRFLHETKEVKIGSSLAPEQQLPVPLIRLVVTGVDSIPLGDRWLAFQVGVQQEIPGMRAGRMVNFACSEDYLLGATLSSQARAIRQRAAYAQVC